MKGLSILCELVCVTLLITTAVPAGFGFSLNPGNPEHPRTSSSIYFQSNLDFKSPNVRVDCRNSYVTNAGIDKLLNPDTAICPQDANYWLKHSVLSSTQRMNLAFVPGLNGCDHNRIWCWSCRFEWGSNFIINDIHIFPESVLSGKPRESPEDIYFQLRPDGIYRRIRTEPTEQNNEEELYILIKEWTSVNNFSCQAEGKFRDPVQCNVFHDCSPYQGGFVHNILTCPEKTVYCEGADKCDYEPVCPCNNDKKVNAKF